jgi:hypothetical protein
MKILGIEIAQSISLGEFFILLGSLGQLIFSYEKKLHEFENDLDEFSSLLEKLNREKITSKDLALREADIFNKSGYSTSLENVVKHWYKEYLEGPMSSETAKLHIEKPIIKYLIDLKKKQLLITYNCNIEKLKNKMKQYLISFLKTHHHSGKKCLAKYDSNENLDQFMIDFIDRINQIHIIRTIDLANIIE